MEQNKKPKPWTKRERTVYKNGPRALALAVIRQWELDGCPERDSAAIDYWKGVANCASDKQH